VSPQLVNGASQTTMHEPSTQSGDPFAGMGQSWPQAPQFRGFVIRSRQTSPQASYGSGHTKSQRPPTHVGSPRAGAVHVAPQPPQ
jgi:hypothetical protein